jgi:uridine kinase
MIKLLRSPLFWLGLVIKLVIIFTFSSPMVTDFFAPFIESSIGSLTLDPWASWLKSYGSPLAFSYGYGMWIPFLPLALIGEKFGVSIALTYELTLLFGDFALLCVLNSLLVTRQRLVLFAYWLSPVVILTSYGLGLNDILPVLFLMIAVLYLRRHQMFLCGCALSLAISAKLSMVMVAPFFILYLCNNKSLRHLLGDFGFGLVACLCLLVIPFVLSSAGVSMLLANPGMSEILSLSMKVSKDSVVYFLPTFFFTILYLVWKARRLNFDLFMSICGIVFLSLVVLMPSASGWFIWAVPFLVFYQANTGRRSVMLISLYSAIFVMSILSKDSFYLNNGQILDFSSFLPAYYDISQIQKYLSVIDTGIFVIGIVLALRMWRESISDNDFFRKTRQPIIIGIAGDSGAGKDTVSEAISGLFGNHSITTLSGDDYHIWDRHKPMWQVMTHLNPMANDLEGFKRDLMSLTDGKSITARHYDHTTGKMSKLFKISSNDFIISSGLHSLYLPQLRDCYDLKIYLDIDEDLRRYFKIQRDVGVRGHPLEKVIESLNIRESDAEKFIRSQKKYADLLLSLQPIHPSILHNSSLDISRQLKLVVTSRNGLSESTLQRALVGLCGLHVDIIAGDYGSEVSMSIEGDVSKEDISMAAMMACPGIFEFLDIYPKWRDGMSGIMQLITMCHIDQVFAQRDIK